MSKRITVQDAYRASMVTLPPGYSLEHGADVLLLRRADGSTVAAFSARGGASSEVARLAGEDYRTTGKKSSA